MINITAIQESFMGLPSTSSLNPNAPVFVPALYQAAAHSLPESSLNPNAPLFVPALYQAAADSPRESSLNPNAPVFVPASYQAAGGSSQVGWGLITQNESRSGYRSDTLRALSNTTTMQMEVEAACKTLPDDFVEKIITMMPFPAIFKARCLSKTWYAKTLSFSTDDEEAKRCLVPSFHKQVLERSSTWGVGWPVFIRKGSLRGYDSTFQLWRRMPSLAFLPCDRLLNRDWSNLFHFHVEIQGALLFAAKSRSFQDIYVANILTQSWKSITPPYHHSDVILYRKLVIENSSQTYRVILFGTSRYEGYWLFLTYDSKSDAWRRDQFARRRYLVRTQTRDYPNTGAYVNGILYVVSLNYPELLMSYNLEDGTFESPKLVLNLIRDLARDNSNWVVNVDLVADNPGLLMIFSLRSHTQPGRFVSELNQRVLRIDLESGELLQLAQRSGGSGELGCISDGKCITFGKKLGSRRVHQYNLHTNQWSSFYAPKDCRWLGSCFQPGVNPFMKV